MRNVLANWIWLLLFGALAFGFIIGGWSASKEIPPQQNAQRTSAAQGGAESQSTTISEPHAEQSSTKAGDKKEPHGNPVVGWITNFFEVKLTDLLIAIFTVVLAVKTSGLFAETGRLREATDKLYAAGERQLKLLAETSATQSRDMQDSIKAAQAAVKASQKAADAAERSVVETDRAWIEVEINILGPLIFGEEEIEIEAEAIFTNTGRSPAVNVGFEFKLYTDIGEASGSASDSAKKIGRSFISFLGSGQVIYPGKNANIKKVLKIRRADFIARIKEIDAVEVEDKTEPFVTNNPALMAFVWYGLPRAGRMGKYRFSTGLFEVGWRADAFKGFDGSVMTAPLDQIEPIATYYSGEFA